MQRVALAPDHEISRVIRGGWQMAGGHGAINAGDAVAAMVAFADAGITAFDCADIYTGKHGKSLHLDGLESSNSNARHRHVVIHGADYVSQKTIDKTGRIGRSEGCPAVENQYSLEVVNALSNGSLMILWKTGA